MAVEAKRGCGYRKIGGTYLVSEGEGFACGRIPIPIVPCPLCDHRPAFTRGLQRIEPANFLHAAPECKAPAERCAVCPLNQALHHDTAGLMWIGDAFYTPDDFRREAASMGVSKRIGHIPKWYKVGEMWVFLAHEKVFTETCPKCAGRKVLVAAGSTLFDDCDTCEGQGVIHRPGVFYACRPSRLERIIADTMPEEQRAALREAGFTLVEVPATDPDHGGKAREEG